MKRLLSLAALAALVPGAARAQLPGPPSLPQLPTQPRIPDLNSLRDEIAKNKYRFRVGPNGVFDKDLQRPDRVDRPGQSRPDRPCARANRKQELVGDVLGRDVRAGQPEGLYVHQVRHPQHRQARLLDQGQAGVLNHQPRSAQADSPQSEHQAGFQTAQAVADGTGYNCPVHVHTHSIRRNGDL